MRIVFPTDENIGYLSKRGAHFGKAKFYTIITLENDVIADVEVIENNGHNSVCGDAVTNILQLKPDILIVNGIGATPAEGFARAGLDIYFDQEINKVEDSIKLLVAGKLYKSNGEGSCNTNA